MVKMVLFYRQFNKLIQIESMSKIEELQKTYLKDADQMASKSRFGYFSIPPNANAGMSAPEPKKLIKDENGKVKTQERNIFSGITASGVLKKSFFSYQPSVYQGDPFSDPGKHLLKSKIEENKKLIGKDVYKPLDLVKTPEPKSSYQHIPQKPVKKTVKDCVDENGKVITEHRNIMTNSMSNIQKQRLKQVKYIPDPYQNNLKIEKQEAKKSINLRGEAPFKPSSPVKKQFFTYRQTYGQDPKCKSTKKQKNQKVSITIDHEANFKPSCSQHFDTFSYPEYMPGGIKEHAKTSRTDNGQANKDKFKIHAPFEKSKPSPSIATFKSNILRGLR